MPAHARACEDTMREGTIAHRCMRRATTFWRTMSTASSKSVAANRSVEGPLARSITAKIHAQFPELQVFHLSNDTWQHAGHAGVAGVPGATESHFCLELVSPAFLHVPLPQRHRQVYRLLEQEMQTVHALQLTTRTPEEQLRAAARK